MIKEEFNRNIDFFCRLPDGRPMQFEIELSDWMKTVMADMGDEIDSPISGNVIHNGEYYDLWTILTDHFATVEDNLKGKLKDLKKQHSILEKVVKSAHATDKGNTELVKEIAWLEVEIFEIEKRLQKEEL